MSVIQEALKKAEKESKIPAMTVEERKNVFIDKSMERSSPEGSAKKIITSKKFFILFFMLAFGVISLLVVNYGQHIEKSAGISSEQQKPFLKSDMADSSVVAQKEASWQAPVKLIQEDLFNSDTTGKLELSGIMYSKSKPLAVINNNVMKEGDEVRGAKIIDIKQDSVDIKADDGETLTLYLKK